MGLKIKIDSLRKHINQSKNWHTSWASMGTGGLLLATALLFFITALVTTSVYTTHEEKKQELYEEKNKLEKTKNLFFLNEQYQAAIDNKATTSLAIDFERFNKPSNTAQMKSYLKKWQSTLKIKSLHVSIGNSHPYAKAPTDSPPDTRMMTASIELKAHVLNDKMLYELIDHLQKDAPGYVTIRKIDLKRIVGASPETLDQLISGKTTSLIEGIVSCDWFYMSEA